MGQSREPDRDIIRIAIKDHNYQTDLLSEVMAYCWEQLMWRESDAVLLERLDDMRAEIEAA